MLAAQYLFMIDYAAPRFLLPAYALLAIPVADALGFAVTGVRWDLRPAMAAAVTCFLVVQLASQHLVLDHEVGGTITFHRDYRIIVAALARRGVSPPCYLARGAGHPDRVLRGLRVAGEPRRASTCAAGGWARPPSYARSWHSFRITGTTVLHVTAYVAPA